MVVVPLYIAPVPLKVGSPPLRLVSECHFRVVAHSVRLHVSLGNDIYAVLVAELIPVTVVWIVAGAHRIDIELFHNAYILQHSLLGYHIATVRIEFVTVNSLDKDRLAVDKELGILDFNFSETGSDRDDFTRLATLEKCGSYSIEIRSLRSPFFRIVHIHYKTVVLLT